MRRVFQRARMLVVTLAILTAGVTGLWAASEVRQGGSPLTVDKTASGQKVTGVVTIYYEDLGNTGGRCGLSEVNMFFFMRLDSGGTQFGFAGSENSDPAAAPLCYEDVPAQQAIVEAFVETVAVPNMFGQTPQDVALKSSGRFVQDNQILNPGAPLFATMDVEFAVRF